jgi:hypothetical protein
MRHIKQICGIYLIALVTITNLKAQTLTLSSNGTNDSAVITVQSNQVAKITYWEIGAPSGTTFARTVLRVVTDGFQTNNIAYNYSTNGGIGSGFASWSLTPFAGALPSISGPATMQLLAASADPQYQKPSSVCTVQISTENSTISNSIPYGAVIIPADTNGPVTILLESSIDLITWTAANPGTYGTATSNRFFRVRAVR